jgi:hypothetical protein
MSRKKRDDSAKGAVPEKPVESERWREFVRIGAGPVLWLLARVLDRLLEVGFRPPH